MVGINLLREGLDLPEVGLVAILDADKEGFLRSEGSLIQTVGRAARNVRGKAINIDDFILIEEVDKLTHEEHVKYEQERMTRCITYLKGLLDDVSSQGSA